MNGPVFSGQWLEENPAITEDLIKSMIQDMMFIFANYEEEE